jgi:hypothetical protein
MKTLFSIGLTFERIGNKKPLLMSVVIMAITTGMIFDAINE